MYADSNGRIEIKINDKTLAIYINYPPTNNDPTFFNTIFSKINNFFNVNLILGRDLVLNDQLDKDGSPPHTSKNYKHD